ncbi:MAG TPA: outer membrane protein assembly factor BamD [Patescibacteria group bacterium]|nr:outer membrane protein assembly factor BamD [Patescibacteria group bacterium]
MKLSANRNILFLALVVSLSLGTSGCLSFGGKSKTPLAGMHAAPDAVLYSRAMNDIKHNRYTIGRLGLQTLINTYPDSEYLAKAKLAIANSYYAQGGTDGLTQAAAQYRDFITFFPFLHEAAFAQYRIAMAHFRMMEKPDRDPTQALDAESELQTMILKYPKSRWTAQAMQRLRDVQEVLAEGEFEVASFYNLRRAYGAAAARLLDLTERYPLFSQADEANFMLGKIYEKSEHNNFAARFYSKIVRDYPLSSFAPQAKSRLVALGFPVPPPDPKALARMRDEEKYIHERPGLVRQALGIVRSGPDISRAAHYGEPDLSPDTNIISARQVLEPSVVSTAASSTTTGVGTISATAVAPGSNSDGASLTSPAEGSGTGSSVAASTDSSAAPASSVDSQPLKDPSKGPPAGKKRSGKENGKAPGKNKKKKGLFHKLIPW